MLLDSEIVTAAQMRAIESAAISSGNVTGARLMERAGRAVVDAVMKTWPRYAGAGPAGPWRALVLCGPGNNGGDGFVIARLLAEAGWSVEVNMLGKPEDLPLDARAAHDRWLMIGPVGRIPHIGLIQTDLLVDALFGIGLTRPVEGALADLFEDIAEAQGNLFCGPRSPGIDDLVSVDVPSGLCAESGRVLDAGRDACIRADLTVTFHHPKPGHLLADGPLICGELVVADIGLRPRPTGEPPLRIARFTARPKRHGHKYDHGHALILTGPAGRGGAARLAARAALRIGAGLVTMGCPGDALAELAAPPDALMRRVVEDAGGLREMLADRRIGALCLGPGMGIGRAAGLLPAALDSGRPCVLDADALSALAARDDPFAGLHPGCVLTPHLGEFARLFPDLARRLAGPAETGPAFSKLEAARQAAARSGAALLLKGPDTVIAAPDGAAWIHSAYDVPWLATAGAGDVLAGMIAGLLARGIAAPEAAAGAAALHAAAARHFGPGLIADDLPEQIPALLRGAGMPGGG